MMDDCPPIERLLVGRVADVDAAHVAECLACQGVLAMVVERGDPTVDDPLCGQAELWLAARETDMLDADDASRLEAHLVRCAGCREASTLGN